MCACNVTVITVVAVLVSADRGDPSECRALPDVQYCLPSTSHGEFGSDSEPPGDPSLSHGHSLARLGREIRLL